jgi:spoIIIJ-associated protein
VAVEAQREFEGKDLAAALSAAAATLGLAAPELDYEVLEPGRRGLFGLGARSVRIRVRTPKPEAPRASRSAEREPGTEAPLPPGAERVVETVERMLALMKLRATARARARRDSGLGIELSGADRELLTRKDAELLSALQFLLNRMGRRAWPELGRIHVSCEGKQRSDEEVERLAEQAAREVARTGRPKRLPPMNAYERRLAHVTVRNFEGLGSRSVGDGLLKRVRIFPET